MTKIAVAGATGRVGRHVVDVLEANGHKVVAIARSTGVDVITAPGSRRRWKASNASSTQPHPRRPTSRPPSSSSPRRPPTCRSSALAPACARIVVVSIIGIDRFSGGYNAAKVLQEQSTWRARSRSASCARRSSTSSSSSDGLGPAGRRSYVWRCARSSSPRARWPRRSARWPPRKARPGARRRPDLEIAARARRASSRPRGGWRRARRPGTRRSRRPARPLFEPAARCPAPTPSSPARRSRSGSTHRSAA